jgi:3-oxosteroid 1-dehydrogenase
MHAQPSGKGAFHPGRSFVDVGNVEYAERPDAFSHVAGGTALVVQLLRGCLENGVQLVVDAPLRELLVEDGRVVGARIERDGELVDLRARRGVLVATGGFAQNAEMKRAYFDRHLDLSCEIKPNQGDGQRAGAAAGAQLANMGDAWWMPMVDLGDNATAETEAFSVREARCLPHTMCVDHGGRRFINESLNYYNFCEGFGIKRGVTAPRTAWLVFDAQARAKYSMFNGAPPPPPGKPRSWLHEAATLEELAATIGVDPATLVATTERFNGFARTGRDLDFDRGEGKFDIAWGDPAHEPNPALGPIEQGPFYAVELRPGALATKGGLKINPRAEVLSAADGQPIEGLYAAGNASAGPVPYAYPGPGSTLGAGMTFGYIAAQAMAEAELAATVPTTRSESQ